MGCILDHKTKFLNMGGVDLHDNTAKNEQKLRKRLLDLVHQNILARDVYDMIRPTGSQRPRMYGLPKTHKENIPLRPILSMIGSSQYELAKWLAEIVVPVLKLYSSDLENIPLRSLTLSKTVISNLPNHFYAIVFGLVFPGTPVLIGTTA